MLFEEVMMKYHFGVAREIGYTDRPTGENLSCADYIVRWGVRHRSGDALVKPRARQVLEFMFPTENVEDYLVALEAPVALVNGVDWCSNLDRFGSSLSTRSATPSRSVPLRPDDRLAKSDRID